MIICEIKQCTGCGACTIICPQKCINLKENSIGTLLPEIEEEKCIKCGLCKKVCHINTDVKLNYPNIAYASYNMDVETRKNSASGGIAASIYQYALDTDYFIMGTILDVDNGVRYEVVKDIEDIKWAQNSKYVYSSMQACFLKYEAAINNGRKTIFIGLPCQVSALKNYLEMKHISEGILYVEIICHGVPNWKMLREHIDNVEKKKGKKIDRISFRWPHGQFDLRMYSGKRLIYLKPMHWDDEYFRAFSVGLIFRENCYNCMYARQERGADLTIGDYSGLGDLQPWINDRTQISVILANSKGKEFISNLSKSGYIYLENRLIEEPMKAEGNPQLRYASVKHINRDTFIEEYARCGKFDVAVQKSLQKEFEDFNREKRKLKIKKILHDYLPLNFQKKLKAIISK